MGPDIEEQHYWVSSNIEEQKAEDIIRLLRFTYWAKDRAEERIRKSLQHSVCFGVFAGAIQIGFCRVVTDYTTFGYLADVVIDPDYRGRGLSKLLLQSVLDHPELQGLRRFCLMTDTSHGLYRKFGFENLENPSRYMERYNPI